MQDLKSQFPIFKQKMNEKPLIYLDNAATTQKPQSVIDTELQFYQEYNANIHRGVYELSQKATDAYENSRKSVADFIHAKSEKEIVFTKGATEAINLIAHSFGQIHIQEGDEVLITEMEHHANLVPWQILCEQKNATLRFISLTENGELDLTNISELITPKTKIVSVVYTSNTLGTTNPIKKIIQEAHKQNIPVLIDACQSIAHEKIDVQELDADFLVFSGHKMYGPTGIGVLYGKEDLLNSLPPYQSGGDMIRSVSMNGSTFQDAPGRFEAGTPPIAQAIGLATAIDFLTMTGINKIQVYEQELLSYATEQLLTIPGLRIIGTAPKKGPIISFIIEGIHPHDLGTILDQEGIAVRTGHHCTQPIMNRYKIPATTRISLAPYNTKRDIDQAIIAIKKAQTILL